MELKSRNRPPCYRGQSRVTGSRLGWAIYENLFSIWGIIEGELFP